MRYLTRVACQVEANWKRQRCKRVPTLFPRGPPAAGLPSRRRRAPARGQMPLNSSPGATSSARASRTTVDALMSRCPFSIRLGRCVRSVRIL